VLALYAPLGFSPSARATQRVPPRRLQRSNLVGAVPAGPLVRASRSRRSRCSATPDRASLGSVPNQVVDARARCAAGDRPQRWGGWNRGRSPTPSRPWMRQPTRKSHVCARA